MPVYIPAQTGPTSHVDSYPALTEQVVRRALRIVGAYQSTNSPRPEQLSDAIYTLNVMLKTWSIEGFLWLRQFITVTLVAGQNSYTLGPNGTPAIDRPTHVFTANKKNSSGSEIPMIALTRTDWFNVPNKTSNGVPVQYYYDPQTINGILYVWPTPQTGTTDVIVLDVDRQLDIQLDNLNQFDFPPQWTDAITYGLAARLAPEYGVPLAEREIIGKEFSALFLKAVNDDRDIASVYMGVRKNELR